MEREIINDVESELPETGEGARLWVPLLVTLCVVFVVVFVVGAAGYRLLSGPPEVVKPPTYVLDLDSLRAVRNAATRSGKLGAMEDSLEKIEILKATVTGLRGFENVQVPYASDVETITRLIGRPQSTGPSPANCPLLSKTLQHHYGRIFIDVDPDGSAIMRTIDLSMNPEARISAGQFILSRSTTLEGFKRRFPFSADHKLPDGYYALRPVSRKPGELLHLTFDENGFLVSVRYDVGC